MAHHPARPQAVPDCAGCARRCKLPALPTWKGHTGRIRDVAFSPVAPLLATCADDDTIRLWNLGDEEPPVRVIGPGPFGGGVRSIAFTPDGRYLATANANGTVYLLSASEPPDELTVDLRDSGEMQP